MDLISDFAALTAHILARGAQPLLDKCSGKTHWSPNLIPDLRGRVAIVTGGNAGIGFITALELTKHGAKVYLACRDPTRASKAIQEIKALVPDSNPQFLKFDLTSLNSATAAAHEFLKLEQRLDILVNNAGIAFSSPTLSEDGIELTACNGTGHFAFTIPLMGLLEKTSQEADSDVRVVNVASDAYLFTWKADFSSLSTLNTTCHGTRGRYSTSKLTNILFTKELQRRLVHTSVTCISVHPGAVNTNIWQGGSAAPKPSEFVLWIQSLLFITPEEGAITQLYAATTKEVPLDALRNAYLVPFGRPGYKNRLARDEDNKLGISFWNLCEALIRDKVKS